MAFTGKVPLSVPPSIKKSFHLLLLASTKWYCLLQHTSSESIEMSPPKSRKMARFSHVLPLVPQNCLSAFKQLAMQWSGLVRLAFHSLKRQVPIRVN